MADTSRPADVLSAQSAAWAQTVAQIRECNERLIAAAVAQGSRRLDAYERALTTLVVLTEKADITPWEWLSALAQAHAEFIRDVSTAYTTTVRVLLG